MENNNLDILENLDLLSLENVPTDSSEDISKEKETNYTENIQENLIDSNDKDSITIFVEETEEKNTKINRNTVFHSIKFTLKYLLTSVSIFALLLITTNYSAYINIAKGYLFQKDLERTSTSIISSVEAAKISESVKTKKEIIKKINQENKNPNSSKYAINNITRELQKKDYKLDIEITPFENRVIIPKIWKNIPLLDIQNQEIAWPKELENIFMDELKNWVIRYPGSTKPWKDWNTFVFWHSSNFPWIEWDYNDVFALLDKVSYWDEVIMYYNQKKYTYKIREKKVINPWDVDILKRNKNKDELTIMTCWPVWTTLNRLIVVWEIVEESDYTEPN